MRAVRLVLGVVAALLVASCASLPETAKGPAPLLILVSIDGFRADYLERGETPNLSALAAAGARGVMRPSFPSLTYPNHYTLVTGVRPDRSGVVNNVMRDPRRPGVVFKMADRATVRDGFWWQEATPVWVTAERHGMKTAPLFWPGSEAEIDGVRPSYRRPYDAAMTYDAEVAQVLDWVDLPEGRRPGFITLYYAGVDHAGHDHGPDSAEVDAAVRQVDASIGQLREGLRQRGLDGRVNLIVVADHGMAAHRAERFTRLADLLPAESYDLHASGSVAALSARPGHEAEVERALIRTPHPHMQCWRKGDVPARLHYGRNARIADYVCLAEVGGYIIAPSADGWIPKADGGSHGYDPYAPEMAALFIANGPDIRPGVVLPGFDNVDVYSLEMNLLRLPPLASDGSLKSLAAALR